MKKPAYALLMVLLVGACTTANPPSQPKLNLSGYEPITVTASSLDIVREYDSLKDPNDIANRFVIPPQEALHSYFNHRYQLQGYGGDELRVVIEDASMKYREIKQENDTLKWANIGTEDEYALSLKFRIERVGPDETVKGSVRQSYERTLIIPQRVSLAEREERQMAFLDQLIADLDTKTVNAVQTPPLGF